MMVAATLNKTLMFHVHLSLLLKIFIHFNFCRWPNLQSYRSQFYWRQFSWRSNSGGWLKRTHKSSCGSLSYHLTFLYLLHCFWSANKQLYKVTILLNCSQKIKLSLLLLLLGVGIASITDLQLNLLGSILSVLAIATTCVGQIVSFISLTSKSIIYFFFSFCFSFNFSFSCNSP